MDARLVQFLTRAMAQLQLVRTYPEHNHNQVAARTSPASPSTSTSSTVRNGASPSPETSTHGALSLREFPTSLVRVLSSLSKCLGSFSRSLVRSGRGEEARRVPVFLFVNISRWSARRFIYGFMVHTWYVIQFTFLSSNPHFAQNKIRTPFQGPPPLRESARKDRSACNVLCV